MKKLTGWAAGIFVVLVVVYAATRESKVSVGIKRLEVAPIEKSKIVGFELSGQVNATLKKEGNDWFVLNQAGKKFPADEMSVSQFLDVAALGVTGDLVSDRAEKHTEEELVGPKAIEVKLLVEGQKDPVSLTFGKFAATGGTYVKRTGQNESFLTKSSLPYSARRDLPNWRKRIFVPAKPEDLVSVTLKPKGAAGLTLKKSDDGKWAFDSSVVVPKGVRLDESTLARVPTDFAGLGASEFVDDGASDEALGFAGEHATATATTKDGKTITLHIGHDNLNAKDGALVTANGPDAGVTAFPYTAVRVEGTEQPYLIATPSAANLRRTLDDFRDTSLFNYDASKAVKLTVTSEKSRVVLEKQKGAWKLVEPKKVPDGIDFDLAQVDAQLEAFKGTKAAHYVAAKSDDKVTGLNAGSPTVEVVLSDKSRHVVTFGKKAPTQLAGMDEYYVKGAVDGAVYAAAQFVRDSFSRGVEMFRKPPPMPQGGGIQGLDQIPPEIREKLLKSLSQQQPRR